MSSLPFLTSELQALSKEAGRKHADVKEAADKALALLKSSPESALSDLHEASSTAPGKHPVLLAPIVLGCSTKNPKVTSIAVSGLQRLAGVRGAITKATVPTILTTLRSVLSQGVEIQLKILQTLVSLLTNCKDIHDDLLAETLLISFKLLESKIGVVSSTAAATLRQLVMFIFENVDAEDKAALKAKGDPSIPGPIPTDFSVTIPAASSPTLDNVSSEPFYLLPAARDAYLVFDDICLLVNGEQPSFLKLQNLPRTFGLELIESVLSDFSAVFISHPELLHLLRTLLSPLLIRALAEKPSFSTTLRLMRVMYLLLKKFNDHLIMESEIFLCMFIKIVAPGETEGSGGHPLSSGMLPTLSKDGKTGTGQNSASGSSPHWMRVLALEILRGLCGDFELLSKVWARYDAPHEQVKDIGSSSETASSTNQQSESSKVPVFTSMITALNKLATEKPALLGQGTAVISGVVADPHTGEYSVSGVVDGIVGMAHQAATSVGVSGLSQGSLALATATVKLQCIDQLDKSDAPAIPETYVFLLALQCLNAIGEGFAAYTLPLYSALMARRPKTGKESLPAPPAIKFNEDLKSDKAYGNLKVSHDMADAAWPALLASLSFYLTTNLDDDLFTYTLSAFQQFSTTCGVLNLKTPRDAFLITLCKFAVPPPIISGLASTEAAASSSSRPHLNSVLSAGADALGLSLQTTQPMSLSTRNLLCLRSLVHVAQVLAGSLEKTWFYVFEALQNADLVVRTEASRRQKKRSHPPTTAGTPTPSKHATPSQSMSSGNLATLASPSARYLPSDQEEQAAQARAARLFEISKALDDDAFQWFVTALCRLNAEMIGIPASDLEGLDAEAESGSSYRAEGENPGDHIAPIRQLRRTGINVIRTLRPGEKSYAVTKLGDVSIMNIPRLTTRPSEAGWDIIINHLLLVQHWRSAPANVRLQAAHIFDRIVCEAPKGSPDSPEEQQKHTQEQVFQALMRQAEPQDRSQVSTDVEIRQAALDTLHKILESQGHAFLCGWKTIFSMLQTACPAGNAQTPATASASETSAATASKTSQLVRVAFPSLQLICSDFLAALSVEETGMCVATLTAFGRQVEDVNVALTAGNLLWQVSDHLQAARRQAKDAVAYLKLWMALLHSLLELCNDRRSEARDGAIQILWRSIELYGATLDERSWEECLSDIIFPLFNCLNHGLKVIEQEGLPDNVERTALGLPLPYKQWDDSKILAISSAGTVFANELSSEIANLSSFEEVCRKYIAYMKESFMHDRPSVATAAAKALEKVSQIEWDESRTRQGSFLASSVWDAWLEMGHDIEEQPKHGLTQQNLECFAKIMAAIHERRYMQFDDSRTVELLGVLKTILTYPFSPDYRPDQDVMPAVQTVVVNIIDQLDLSSSFIASAVLQDLAEYVALAYTSVSEVVKSPTFLESPRMNQKVTYIALSKACTGRILDVYQRFKEEPDIYESAVESVLSAYAVPLRLKYECPLPSRFGNDPPLWKTATLHFLQLARSVVTSLELLADRVEDEVASKVWRHLVACFRAILQADCRSVMDMSLEDQRGEEDFDLAVIITLEGDILPSLGNQRVPTDAIVSLAQALCNTSHLHNPPVGLSSDSQMMSPSLTAVSSRDSGDAESHAGGKGFSEYNTLGSSDTTLDGTTMDDYELPRERFAYWCLDLLFLMSNRTSEISTIDRKRIAVLALPLLLSRCSAVLRLYLADSAVRGKVPFRRVREEELAYILHRLRQLELDEGVFEAAFAREEDPVKVLTEIENGDRALSPNLPIAQVSASATRRSSKAHLYELYPQLLALVTLPRLSNVSGATGTVPYAALDFASPVLPSQGPMLQHGNGSSYPKNEYTSRISPPSSPSTSMDTKGLARACLQLVGEGFYAHTK